MSSTKRYLRFNGLDMEIELGRVTAIDMPKKMFVIEEMKDGKYRLTYSKNLVSDIQKLTDIEIVRLND